MTNKQQPRNYDAERYVLTRADLLDVNISCSDDLPDVLDNIKKNRLLVCIACDECKHAMAVTDREFVCYHPTYKNGKKIYRETYGVLKKLGCGSAEKGKRSK